MAKAIVQAPCAKTNLSRRNILSGALALPLAALPAVATAAGTDRAAWDAAVADYRRLEAAELAHVEQWEAATRAVYAEVGPEPGLVLTCKAGSLRYTRAELAKAAARYRGDPTLMGRLWHIRGQIELHDRWTAYEAANDAARARHNLGAIEREGERLAVAAYEARWRLIEAPAPDGKALALKMAVMREHESFDCPSAIEAIIADAQRLAGNAPTHS